MTHLNATTNLKITDLFHFIRNQWVDSFLDDELSANRWFGSESCVKSLFFDRSFCDDAGETDFGGAELGSFSPASGSIIAIAESTISLSKVNFEEFDGGGIDSPVSEEGRECELAVDEAIEDECAVDEASEDEIAIDEAFEGILIAAMIDSGSSRRSKPKTRFSSFSLVE